MPLYEFRCKKHQHKFEQSMKMNDPNPPCPVEEEGEVCGGETEKMVSRGSFQLKGSGWYKDGY